MTMRFARDLSSWFGEEFGAAGIDVPVDLCPPDREGDVTVNCFRFARLLGRDPAAVAAAASSFLARHEDVEKASPVKAFVNVTLKTAALFRDTVADIRGLLAAPLLPEGERRRILVEYSAPNTNKPLHLGHMRNNVLGAALVALLKRIGHEVIAVNLVNDRGIHICKSMIAYQRFGAGGDPRGEGMKGDHYVGRLYVRFNEELKAQVEALRARDPGAAGKSDEELFGLTEIGRAARDLLKKWEAGDEEVRALWKKMNDWVLDGFEETYRRMGIVFDRIYRESETYRKGKEIVERGLADGIFTRRRDGAVEADLSAEKLGRKVLLRADGTSVYITQDLGTTLIKEEEFSPEGQIWVVGDEQIHHFKVLFALLGRLGFPFVENFHHMAYGMVDLPSGRMKSREGTVVDADDLLDEMENLAREACLERCAPGEDPPADIERRALVIGHGALKFWLLKFKPRSRILFDPAASLRFEGDTGPYVQYACARIRSILAKAGPEALEGEPPDFGLLDAPAERNLALRCSEYPARVRRAAAALDPSILAEFLLDVAKDFSRFYNTCPVLRAGSAEKGRSRLALCKHTLRLLEDGLKTLTIDVLESM